MNNNKIISYGDRIFARVISNGKIILDFVTENVSNLMELMMELRRNMEGCTGLVRVSIRNYHQGWGEEKWMMMR